MRDGQRIALGLAAVGLLACAPDPEPGNLRRAFAGSGVLAAPVEVDGITRDALRLTLTEGVRVELSLGSVPRGRLQTTVAAVDNSGSGSLRPVEDQRNRKRLEDHHDGPGNPDLVAEDPEPEGEHAEDSARPGDAPTPSWHQTSKGRLVIGTGALLAAAWASRLAFPADIAHWAFILATLIGLVPVARRAFAMARARMPFTIEMLMTIAAGGALGALAGSFMLAFIPPNILLTVVGLVVVLYIAFRLIRADWVLSYSRGLFLAGPAGFAGGLLQGAAGLSAPVSMTFMSAMKLERPTFIATISVFFMLMSIIQGPTLAGLGLLSWTILLHGMAALALMLGFMPVGAWLARRVRRETFDKLILVLLGAIAAKILVTAFL